MPDEIDRLEGRRIAIADNVARLIGRLAVSLREEAEIRGDLSRHLGVPVTDDAWRVGITLELSRAGLLDVRPDAGGERLVSLLEAQHRDLRMSLLPAAAE